MREFKLIIIINANAKLHANNTCSINYHLYFSQNRFLESLFMYIFIKYILMFISFLFIPFHILNRSN